MKGRQDGFRGKDKPRLMTYIVEGGAHMVEGESLVPESRPLTPMCTPRCMHAWPRNICFLFQRWYESSIHSIEIELGVWIFSGLANCSLVVLGCTELQFRVITTRDTVAATVCSVGELCCSACFSMVFRILDFLFEEESKAHADCKAVRTFNLKQSDRRREAGR